MQVINRHHAFINFNIKIRKCLTSQFDWVYPRSSSYVVWHDLLRPRCVCYLSITSLLNLFIATIRNTSDMIVSTPIAVFLRWDVSRANGSLIEVDPAFVCPVAYKAEFPFLKETYSIANR